MQHIILRIRCYNDSCIDVHCILVADVRRDFFACVQNKRLDYKLLSKLCHVDVKDKGVTDIHFILSRYGSAQVRGIIIVDLTAWKD